MSHNSGKCIVWGGLALSIVLVITASAHGDPPKPLAGTQQFQSMAPNRPDEMEALTRKAGMTPAVTPGPLTISSRSTQTAVYREHGINTNGALPRRGSRAPDFSLETVDGRRVSLANFQGKPLVLIFGSITCPVYRGKIGAVASLQRKHRTDGAFLVIYTIEAHPKGSSSPYSDRDWIPEKNISDNMLKPQPTTFAERKQLATMLVRDLGETLPVAVDAMDNQTWRMYGARPNAAFLLDATGRIRLAQDWCDPELLDAELSKHP